MSEMELRVSKIKDGTVIDHISGGYALDVIKILGITGKEKRVITIGINVPSKRFGVKDIVKIEGRALNSQEVNRIALVAPHASINARSVLPESGTSWKIFSSFSPAAA